MTNITKKEYDKVKFKSNYYEGEYQQLQKKYKELEKENINLSNKLEKQDTMLQEKNFGNNNMKKSLYVIVNALHRLEEDGITNHTLSKSMTDIFNASLSGIHNRQIESVFDTDDIIDGYTISKDYREADKECNCPVCTNKVTPKDLINFLEAEVFSSEEFQNFVEKVMKEDTNENEKDDFSN